MPHSRESIVFPRRAWSWGFQIIPSNMMPQRSAKRVGIEMLKPFFPALQVAWAVLERYPGWAEKYNENKFGALVS